jgi:hypothetical protein
VNSPDFLSYSVSGVSSSWSAVGVPPLDPSFLLVLTDDAGIAVGAGELEEETLKKLNETRAQLRDAIGALADAKAENEQLKAQLVALDRSADDL